MSLLSALRSPAARAAPAARAHALKASAASVLWSLLVPATVTLLALRWVVPSRMQVSPGGLGALVARFADDHPLILGVVLYVAVTEAIGYWRDRFDEDSRRVRLSAGRGVPLGPRRVVRLVAAVVLAAVVAAGFRSSVAEVYRVASVSMLPTLDVGDRLLVDKLAYGFKLPFSTRRIGATLPRRGDVVVFPGAEVEGSGAVAMPIVKRVIGLPGDYIAFQMGHAIVNNWIVPSCDAGPFAAVMGRLTVRGRLVVEFLDDQVYLTVRTPGAASFSGYRVLPGQVFVIGDDRGISSDSRVWNAGRGGGVYVGGLEGRVTRILAGGRRDGRLDLGHLLAPLGLEVREPDVDLHKSEALISDCLRNPPPSTRAPASGA